MTVYMLLEAVRDGRLQMDTRLPVSTKAREMKGSTMFLNERDRPTVEELITRIVFGKDITNSLFISVCCGKIILRPFL